MGLLSFFQTSLRKEWTNLNRMDQLAEIDIKSNTKTQIILKHSTRCSISGMAKDRMEVGLEKLITKADIYYLDLLAHRNISDKISEKWKVEHESPQVIIIKNGEAIYHASHSEINVKEIEKLG